MVNMVCKHINNENIFSTIFLYNIIGKILLKRINFNILLIYLAQNLLIHNDCF